VAEGSVGAGTGATVGKLLGLDGRGVKGGLGTASIAGPRGIIVGALAVTNALGSVFDPATGECIAGPRAEGGGFVSLPGAIAHRTEQMHALLENTTLMCVATNARLEANHLQRLAMQAHDGFARVVSPAHTFGDGDVAFALSMGQLEIRDDDVLTVSMLGAQAMSEALLRSVRQAKGLKGIPSANEWRATMPGRATR
jgi:L-aminopeptidase/D-esterase-like protein